MPKRMLLGAAMSLCNAFAEGKPTEELLTYFTEHEAVAIEHGHPSLAPWLGREFIGHKEIASYFNHIAAALRFENMTFQDFFVDDENYRVGVTGKARWTYKKTGKSWDETFTYTLDYCEGTSEEGENSKREVKLKRYAVWADSGALYLASKGHPALQ